jgi:hypothetical protein
MSSGVEVRGAAQLGRTMHRAAVDLDHLDRADARTSNLVAAAARARAPRRTGALALSVRARPERSAAAVEATARYAGYVHNGVPSRGIPARPFLVRAAEATEAAWVTAYVADIDHVLSQVEGI